MRRTRDGFLTITVLMIVTGLVTLTMVGLTRSSAELFATERTIIMGQTFFFTEAAIDAGRRQFTQDTNNNLDPKTTTRCDLTDATGWVVGVGPELGVEYCIDPVTDETLEDLPSGQYQFARLYRIVGRQTGGTRVIEHYIRRVYTPIFQHLVFYENDLEIMPGQNMTLGGKVFTNKDLYLHPYHDLKFNTSLLASAGQFYASLGFNFEGDNPDDRWDISGSAIKLKFDGAGPWVDLPMDHWDDPGVPGGEEFPLDDLAPDWVSGSTTRWGETFRTAAHGVLPQQLPDIEAIQQSHYFDERALECGVKIIGRDFEAGAPPQVYVEGLLTSWDAVLGDISEARSTFTDWREKAGDYAVEDNAYVLNVEIDELQSYLSGYSGWDATNCPDGFNGVVYATWEAQPGDGDHFGAVRLRDGGSFVFDTAFVSDGPVYIEGDFNTGTASEREAVSILSDALTILSEDWDSHASNPTLSPDPETDIGGRVVQNDIEVNGAFVTGIVETGGCESFACYSGGFENYPHFLQNWDGKTVTIIGSFVQLWDSLIATSPWKQPGGNPDGSGNHVYDVPERDWSFDENFETLAGLPPLPPNGLKRVSVAWKEGFQDFPAGGSGGCFLAGTPILLPDGRTQPIEALQVGDLIMAFDEDTGELKPDTVRETFVHPNEDGYLIINGHLKVTPNHPVYANGTWVEIGTLSVGETLLNAQGDPEPITSIEAVQARVTVYNLEVNPYHTYIAGGIVVHNKIGGGPPVYSQHPGDFGVPNLE